MKRCSRDGGLVPFHACEETKNETKGYMQKGTWSSCKFKIHIVEPMWTNLYKYGLLDVILVIIIYIESSNV